MCARGSMLCPSCLLFLLVVVLLGQVPCPPGPKFVPKISKRGQMRKESPQKKEKVERNSFHKQKHSHSRDRRVAVAVQDNYNS